MAVFEKRIAIEVPSQKLYDFLHDYYLDEFYSAYLGLNGDEIEIIDDDVVLKEFAEYILNKKER